MLPPGVQNPPVDAQLGSDHSRLGALHPGHRSTLLLPRPKTIRPLHIRSTHTKTSIPWKWGLSILSQFRGSLHGFGGWRKAIPSLRLRLHSGLRQEGSVFDAAV